MQRRFMQQPPPDNSNQTMLWMVLVIIVGVTGFMWYTGRLSPTPTMMPALAGDNAPTFSGIKSDPLATISSGITPAAKFPRIYRKAQYKLVGNEAGVDQFGGEERLGFGTAEDCQFGAAGLGAAVAMFSKGNGGLCRWYKRLSSTRDGIQLRKKLVAAGDITDEQVIEITDELPTV